MADIREKNKRKYRAFLYFYILLALSALLVTATYTWFSLSQTPRVSDMRLSVAADVGLQLSEAYDAPDSEWGGLLDYNELISPSAPLKPVTYSEAEKRFYSARYGFDGRMIDDWQPLSDEQNANRNDSNGYYIVSTFYARADKACSVSLLDAVELNEGINGSGTYVIGTPVWDSQKIRHNNAGNGAETAVRFGFKITHINKATGQNIGRSDFYIYEPNCDRHIGEEEGYIPTDSIDDSPLLISAEKLILQTSAEWSEAEPVQRDVTVKHFGKILSNPVLFSLNAGEEVKIELYIWLEGQDIDCSNLLERESRISANIQFKADFGNQSGIVDIPE